MKLSKMKALKFSFALMASLFVTTPVSAAEPTLIGTYSDWSAFTFVEDGKKVCFMASQPQKAEGNYSKRGEVFALVTHRPQDNSFDVVSFVAGYTYKKNSDVTVTIDSRKFTLFTHSDTAWTPDAGTDKSLTSALQSGSKMVVKGSSTRGTTTSDTYSLKGTGSAYEAISAACK